MLENAMPQSRGAVGALLASLLLTLPAAGNEPVATEAQEPDAQRTYAERKAEAQAKKQRQVEDYRRMVPPLWATIDPDLESDTVKMRSIRNWVHLTYPTGRMPSQPWETAQQHVGQYVLDAPVWLDGGIQLGVDKAAVTPLENTWTAIGPQPLDSTGTTNNAFQYGTVSGRISAGGLAVDPNNTNVGYAGFSSGGFWKTSNLSAGNPTWTPLWDDKDFVTQAAGAIEIDPSDSNTIYVGTGDWVANDQFSAGIMKSTDAGSTWSHLGADVFTPFSPTLPSGGNRWSNQNIRAIEVDPNNTNTVLAGTLYDLYLSNDGGSSWQICSFGNNYTNPAASNNTISSINRISSIFLDGRGGSTDAYIAVGHREPTANGNNGVYRFTVPSSGCPAWPGSFTTLFGGFPSGTGNGTNGSNTGRIELAGSTASGSLTLYAQVARSERLANGSGNFVNEGTFVLRPDGGSTTWSKLSGWNSYGSCSAAGTAQDWYDLFISVDPNNDKQLYIGHIDVYSATVNSGYSSMSQTNLTQAYNSTGGCPHYGKVHPDQHAFAWIGNTGDFLVGNDGGIYKNTTGTGNGWSQLNNGINTLLFYAGQIGADFAGNGSPADGNQWLFGGFQDNGSATWKSSQSDFEWTARSLGGDGFFTTFDPLNGTETAGRWMTEYVFGDLAASTSGANGPFTTSTCSPSFTGSADWSTPFILDTLHCDNNSCDNYLLGEDYVWASASWSGSCPSWSRISGSMVKSASGSIVTVGMAPSEPKAAAIGTDDGNVWWTQTAYSGGNCTQAAANSSSFSCSTNTSASWIQADSSNSTLPNRAVLQVAFDPADHNVFYAAVGGFEDNTPATPGHLFQLTRSGSSISVVDKTGNLPDVPASSVAVNPHDRKQVFVGTYFGFYYTSDIDAATPSWVRYQTGLPNTRIEHLTIDRGPASDPIKGTTLAAFTYGRGAFVLKLPQPAVNANPVVTITAPANGSSADLGTSVSFTGTATDAEDGSLSTSLSWSSSLDGNIGSGASFSLSSLSQGSHTITASVTDSGGASGNASITLSITDPNNNGPQNAAYDSGLGAPQCAIAGSSCDSTTLLVGRNSKGPEPNQPNTLGSCTDGNSGSFHSDESNDKIVVSTLDGSDFTEGATVKIDATVWAYSSFGSDHLDLYYADDANNPSWVFIATLEPTQAGAQTLSTNYTLPNGSLQAVRANFRYQGSASSCGTGNYDDTDDLVFAVKTTGPTNTAPTASISAPSNGTTVTQGASVTFTGSANDTEDGNLSANLSWSSSLDGNIGSGASFSTTNLSLGSHTVTASVSDSGGLSASAQVSVTVNAPVNTAPSVSISAPSNGTSVTQGASVTFTGSANDTEDGNLSANLSWSSSLDGNIGSGASFSTTSLSVGSHTVTASVTDSGGLSGSAQVSVTVTSGGSSNGPQNAVYNSSLGVPSCLTAGSSCDSGTLLVGRNSKGPEPNQPNTLGSGCSDGNSGSFHSDESNDKIVVSTLDSADFSVGATVKIDATVWAWSNGASDHLDLYYAADANNPTWVFIATLDPPAGGEQTLSVNYTLPTGSLQAIRANFRYNGSASSCTSGNYNDHDDLVFAVNP